MCKEAVISSYKSRALLLHHIFTYMLAHITIIHIYYEFAALKRYFDINTYLFKIHLFYVTFGFDLETFLQVA